MENFTENELTRMLSVNFRTVTGKVLQLDISPDATIGDAKRMIEERDGIPAAGSKMILTANILSDDKRIGDIKINNGQYIVIHSARPPRTPSKPVDPPKIEIKPEVKPEVKPEPPVHVDPIRPQRPVSPVLVDPLSSDPVAPKPESFGDPANFTQLVKELTDMGFDEEVCMPALRMSNYNTEMAANLILSGGPIENPASRYSYDVAPPRPRQEPEYNYGRGRYGEMQGMYDGLTIDEKSAVDRISRLGVDGATALQVYIACEKDETLASQCVGSMI